MCRGAAPGQAGGAAEEGFTTMPTDARGEVRAAVAAALTDVEPGELVLVACSGGADSLALAASTAALSGGLHWRVGAVVVDHGLQTGSEGVAAVVAARLERLGLDPVRVVRVEVGAEGGPEAAARTARYDALAAAAAELGARVVLLGHTLDDQAETVLLGLARGSGLRSLSGMAVASGPGGLWRRPLLGLTRGTTRAACAEAGLEVWDDPHNSDERYLRVRVRERVLPVLESELGPGVREALARTAGLAASDAAALEKWAERVGAELGVDGLDVTALTQLPDAVRTRVLRRAAIAAGAPAGRLTLAHVRAVDALVTDWKGQGAVALPGGVSAERRYGRLGFSTGGSVPGVEDQAR